jgi:hypothetical protein
VIIATATNGGLDADDAGNSCILLSPVSRAREYTRLWV